MSRHHSSQRTNHGNNYDIDPRYLPPPDLYTRTGMHYTSDQIAAMQAESSQKARRLECLEAPAGTCKKPVRDQRIDLSLADLLFKRARLHGKHATSTVTILDNQNPGMGNVGQSHMTHNAGSNETWSTGAHHSGSTMKNHMTLNHITGSDVVPNPTYINTNVRLPKRLTHR